MRRLLFLVSFFTCSVAQSQIGSWAGLYSSNKSGVTPASVSILAHNTNTSLTQTVTNTLTGVPAGTLMVITLASAADNVDNPNGAVSSSPTLTWTKQVESKAANSGNTEIWTATFTDGGDIATTSTFVGAGNGLSGVLYSVSNADQSIGGNHNSATAQAQPSVAVTTTNANSILFCVTSDWNAKSGTTTYRRTVTRELRDFFADGYTAWHYYEVVTSAASYTEGITAPTGEASGTSVLEIRGN